MDRSILQTRIMGLAALLLTGLLLAPMASAQLQIEIVDGKASAIPVAVVPFEWRSSGNPPIDGVDKVISGDLARSGQFTTMKPDAMAELPVRESEVRFGTWQALKRDYLVIGNIEDTPDGGYQLTYQLLDIVGRKRLLSRRLAVGPGDLRYGAHRIADDVYETILGVPGAFSTRIAYVTATGVGRNIEYQLVVADADGYGPQAIITSPEPLLSPSWSPDARELAYVSFEKGNSSVWVQDTYTGSRRSVAQFKGINGAPEFSPDGRRLAVSLSRTGNPEIFILELASGEFTQVTNHYGIDTEPAWSPDGNKLYFTSDRSGKPQIYEISSRGGNATRLTVQGEYNATVSVAPDGNHFAVANGLGNQYRIAILDGKTRDLTILSDGPLDESPSFAPNGSMILYASREGGRGVLSAVAADGSVRQRLVFSEGDVREPAWSPLIR